MPHQCTSCGHTFADGSKEMLSGCPDCGGNKFQFKPEGAVDPPDPADTDATTSSPPGSGATSRDSSTPSASRRGTDRDTADSERITETDSEDDPAAASARSDTEPRDADFVDDRDSEVGEDAAQADARSGVVSRDELSTARGTGDTRDHRSNDPSLDSTRSDPHPDSEIRPDSESQPDSERPGLDDLREELNDQFESIRIVSPGKYELNLMELYNRQECIISLQEDGRYVIEMPDAWDATEE